MCTIRNLTNPEIALRQLLSYSQKVKNFLKYTQWKLNFDWERTIRNNKNSFFFTNKNYVLENIDGCPQAHIIVTKNNVYILCREEDVDEYYENHVVFESLITPKKLLKSIEPLYIVTLDYNKFIHCKNKHRYSLDYDNYLFEKKKQLRKEKCLELKIFKIVYSCCKNLPSVIDLKNEMIYNKLMIDKIQEIIDTPWINKLIHPVKQFTFKNIDFEIDYKRKKVYIENIIEYVYGDNQVSKYNNILPNYYKFKSIIYNENIYDVLLVTIFDSILKIFGTFTNLIKNTEIQIQINNIVNNGFSRDLNYKFKKLM